MDFHVYILDRSNTDETHVSSMTVHQPVRLMLLGSFVVSESAHQQEHVHKSQNNYALPLRAVGCHKTNQMQLSKIHYRTIQEVLHMQVEGMLLQQ